jgi:hypothetical protein
MLLRFLLIAVLTACSVEKMPPIAMARTGQPAAGKRVALLPSACTEDVCRGLDELVRSELSFHGYEVVDLEHLPAVERTRAERREIKLERHGSGPSMPRRSEFAYERVEALGPALSDLDAWTLRKELAALGVDSLVRVRSAKILDRPPRMVALVRVTRLSDAALVWSSLCEVEVPSLEGYATGAERSVRCALAKAPW